MNEQTKLFFEEHEKDFVKSLPCLGISCTKDCPYYETASLNDPKTCVQTFKEDWIQYSRKKKLEKLLS